MLNHIFRTPDSHACAARNYFIHFPPGKPLFPQPFVSLCRCNMRSNMNIIIIRFVLNSRSNAFIWLAIDWNFWSIKSEIDSKMNAYAQWTTNMCIVSKKWLGENRKLLQNYDEHRAFRKRQRMKQEAMKMWIWYKVNQWTKWN